MSRLMLLLTLALLATALTLEFKRLTIKPWPPKYFAEPAMHFKYGSIGAEVHGYPYLIWRELPTLFADRIPKGFAQFGFITEPGQTLPIGISVRRYGVLRVGFNCATCHTSQVHTESSSQILLGAPAEQLDLQAYIRFLIEATADPRLTPEAVFDSAKRNNRPVGLFNRVVLKYIVFSRLRAEIAQVNSSFAWMDNRPAHGPGRTDAGNYWRERWGLNPQNDDAVGAVDFPSIWNQRVRTKGWFHWDGNNSSLEERNYSAALAGGAAEWLLDRHSIGRVSDWLLDLQPPPFPGAINRSLVDRGKNIYDHECGSCHDVSLERVGTTTAIQNVKTDPERLSLFSETMVEHFKTVGSGYSWRFHHYRKTDGYLNVPLDGIWARAPYLHNGSVPSLIALLSPAAQRPTRFLRGCTNFDSSIVGFRCESGFEFDTKLKGNENTGHEYGTTLSEPEKTALLEFLKSL